MMIYTTILEVLGLISSDKYIRLSATFVIILSGVLCFLMSPLSGVFVFFCYILGYVISFFMVKYQHYTTSYLEKFVALYHVRASFRPEIKASCSVCDDLTCQRHQIGKSMVPWKNITVNKELNLSIEHFYNRILENFISSWYNQFTDNKEFLNELRYCLRYATAILVNRFFEIDYIDVITNKLVPQAIKHIDDHLYMQQIAKLKNVKFNEVVVEYLGKKLHPATTSRKNEIAYLQHLSNELIKYALPDFYANCRNYTVLLREIVSGWVLLPLMDVLADPNIINSLVIITVNYKSLKTSKMQHPTSEVVLLHDFVKIESCQNSPFATSLSKIKNKTELLYEFMQFLKKHEQVHLLQFCLDVGLISSDKYIRLSATFVIILSGVLCFLMSPLSGVFVFFCYILGYVISFFMVKYQHYTTSYLEKFVALYHVRASFRPEIKASCSVCDDLTCQRHQIGKSMVPWKNITVNKELNLSIEHFYNRILENFISSWYNQFTDNKEFLNELRYCLRYATAILVNRFFEIDYIDVITNKLVPQAIKHIDDHLYMQQIAKLKNVKFNEVVVEYLGKKLHPATTSRKNEIAYLQHLSNELIKYALPDFYANCRNYTVLLREIVSGWVLLPLMDVLADPNIINSLVIITVNYKSLKTSKMQHPTSEVVLLHDFVKIESCQNSPFATSLSKIKNKTELLYEFMQFLKKHEQVHLLQFCLDVDDFNTKLLTPDLTKKQLEELHGQAMALYKEYLNENSFNFIGCPKEICNEYKELIRDIYTVAKLRTSKPLYQAYDFAFNCLENCWLPQFFHSNEFYSYICGSKVTSSYNKASIKPQLVGFGSPIRNKSRKYYEQSNYGAVSKISSSLGKIRGVLKTPTPIEGSLDPLENGATEDILLNQNLIRDLSSWKVTVPTYQITSANKITYFCLNVLHMDCTSLENKVNNWIVWRKDQDFFTLKAKLVEFHGESEICDSPLPSRKAGSAVESRMSKYEDFILKLLQKPSLRGSDLLHTFLTSEEDFTFVISTMAPNNQDIGNIYQSMAYKLRKEKGQYLDGFINTFVNSVVKPKQDKIDLAEEGAELLNVPSGSVDKIAMFPKTYRNDVFKDNFGISYKPNSESSSSTFNPALFSECLFYLLKNIFKMPSGLLKVYVAICCVAQQLIDLVSKIIIDRKIKAGLTQSNLAYLIGLLEGVIFTHHPPLTPQEREDKRRRALSEIQVCPNYVNKILGGGVNEGLTTLLEILQNPHYNKQLAYNLLDTVLLEMFPELGQ